MAYCKIGENPTVVYDFAGGEKKTYAAQKSPITVEATEKIKPGFTGGQCPIIYNVKYQFTHGGPGGNLGATISQGSIDVLGPVYSSGWELYFPPEDGGDRGSGNEARIFIYHSNTKSSQLGMSGGISNNRAIYTSKINSVTRLNGQTDSNEPAFKGGQCDLVKYRVTYDVYGQFCNPNAIEQANATADLWGPITAVRSVYPTSDTVRHEFFCRGWTGREPYPTLRWHPESGGQNPHANCFVAKIKSVVRQDSLTDYCGDPKPVGTCGNPKSYCEMLIKYNDITIFKDQGECPCTFSVQCGDCPDGQVRCDSPGYPGYCCIPCTELAQRLDALTRRIK